MTSRKLGDFVSQEHKGWACGCDRGRGSKMQNLGDLMYVTCFFGVLSEL